jgi:phosphoserine phosphatase RsbU/P
MTLTARLILLVTACIALTSASIAATNAWLAREGLVQQAEAHARLVAGIIAEGAYRSELSADEIEALVRDEMEAQGIILAQLVEAAGEGGGSLDLSVRFAEVAARSVIDDIWLVDAAGRTLARSVGPYRSLPDGLAPPPDVSARAIAALTSGQRFSLSALGPHGAMQYVGVRVPGGRAVLLAKQASFSAHVLERIGMEATLRALEGQEGIRGILVVDDRLMPVAGNAGPLEGASRMLADRAIRSPASHSTLEPSGLVVAAPILDVAGIPTGAAVITLSRAPLDRLWSNTLLFAGLAALALFAIGAAVAAMVARRTTRPLVALTRAAAEMEAGSFQPESLNLLTNRGDELGKLARVFQEMAVQVQAREEHLEALVSERTAKLHEQNLLLEEAKRRMEAELDVARALQAAILPQSLPDHPSLQGCAAMTPAREMGGDFYDFFPLGPDHLGVVMADVSGKGVPAAFFMAISRTVLQSSARDHDGPGACLETVNTLLCDQNPMDLFVTVFYGVLDLTTGVFRYANAGHNPPLMIGSGGGIEALPGTGGTAIGVMPGLKYAEATVTLAPKDTLFLYTDGISEAMDADNREFTEQRLLHALSGSQSKAVDAIVARVTEAVQEFVGDAPQSDDITLMVLRYLGPP